MISVFVYKSSDRLMTGCTLAVIRERNLIEKKQVLLIEFKLGI